MIYNRMNNAKNSTDNQPHSFGYHPEVVERKRQKPRFGINVGSASILLIFVILCLVSFAVLSIVSSNADNKLTEKVLSRTTAYYDACNSAQKSLAGLDSVLQSQYAISADSKEYFSKVGHTKSYAITITDLQTLYVQVEILYPMKTGEKFYRIVSWQTVTE